MTPSGYVMLWLDVGTLSVQPIRPWETQMLAFCNEAANLEKHNQNIRTAEQIIERPIQGYQTGGKNKQTQNILE